jgi:hypothetical protein
MVNIVYVRGPKKRNKNDSFDQLFSSAYDMFKIKNDRENHGKCTRKKFVNYLDSIYYKSVMNIVDSKYTFSFSLKQKSSISSSKRGRYPIHSYEIVILLKCYVKTNGNPASYIQDIDNFFMWRRAQIISQNRAESAVFQKPLVDYYIYSRIKADQGGLIKSE